MMYNHKVISINRSFFAKMELNITKIIDGIFVGNTNALNDIDFILNNKISHLIIWTSNQFYPQLPGITTIYFQKEQPLPTSSQIQSLVEAIQQSREQMLCSFISCEHINEALLLLIPFFVHKYSWSVETIAYFFAQKCFPFEVKCLFDKLSHILIEDPYWAMPQPYTHLKNIEWTEQYLKDYEPKDPDEHLLINTDISRIVESKPKKKKRVQWVDRLPKNSINAGERLFGNSRINNSLKKNQNIMVYGYKSSISKNNQLSPSTPVLNKKNERISSAKKIGQGKTMTKQNNFDDFDYLALKQLSRTNFDDIRFKGSKLRKRISMKGIKIEEQKTDPKKKTSINNNVASLRRKSSNKFLNDLRKMGFYNC